MGREHARFHPLSCLSDSCRIHEHDAGCTAKTPKAQGEGVLQAAGQCADAVAIHEKQSVGAPGWRDGEMELERIDDKDEGQDTHDVHENDQENCIECRAAIGARGWVVFCCVVDGGVDPARAEQHVEHGQKNGSCSEI